VVVEAHFLMRSSTDPDTGALMVSAMQLSLVIADVAMPAAGPLVLDTAFSVQWANATVPDAALQVCWGGGHASLFLQAKLFKGLSQTAVQALWHSASTCDLYITPAVCAFLPWLF
jgi:hypothetical protein